METAIDLAAITIPFLVWYGRLLLIVGMGNHVLAVIVRFLVFQTPVQVWDMIVTWRRTVVAVC